MVGCLCGGPCLPLSCALVQVLNECVANDGFKVRGQCGLPPSCPRPLVKAAAAEVTCVAVRGLAGTTQKPSGAYWPGATCTWTSS